MSVATSPAQRVGGMRALLGITLMILNQESCASIDSFADSYVEWYKGTLRRQMAKSVYSLSPFALHNLVSFLQATPRMINCTRSLANLSSAQWQDKKAVLAGMHKYMDEQDQRDDVCGLFDDLNRNWAYGCDALFLHFITKIADERLVCVMARHCKSVGNSVNDVRPIGAMCLASCRMKKAANGTLTFGCSEQPYIVETLQKPSMCSNQLPPDFVYGYNSPSGIFWALCLSSCMSGLKYMEKTSLVLSNLDVIEIMADAPQLLVQSSVLVWSFFWVCSNTTHVNGSCRFAILGSIVWFGPVIYALCSVMTIMCSYSVQYPDMLEENRYIFQKQHLALLDLPDHEDPAIGGNWQEKVKRCVRDPRRWRRCVVLQCCGLESCKLSDWAYKLIGGNAHTLMGFHALMNMIRDKDTRCKAVFVAFLLMPSICIGAMARLFGLAIVCTTFPIWCWFWCFVSTAAFWNGGCCRWMCISASPLAYCFMRCQTKCIIRIEQESDIAPKGGDKPQTQKMRAAFENIPSDTCSFLTPTDLRSWQFGMMCACRSNAILVNWCAYSLMGLTAFVVWHGEHPDFQLKYYYAPSAWFPDITFDLAELWYIFIGLITGAVDVGIADVMALSFSSSLIISLCNAVVKVVSWVGRMIELCLRRCDCPKKKVSPETSQQSPAANQQNPATNPVCFGSAAPAW